MELSNIEKLLKKYEAGLTSLEEEKQLKYYFSTPNPNLPKHLENYAVLFKYYELNKNEHYKKPIVLKQKQLNNYKWLGIAATLLIGIGLYLNRAPKQEDLGTYNNPELAFKAFKKSLQVVSKNFSKGTNNIEYLSLIDQAGTQVGYLQEIENTTSIIFKTRKNEIYD